MLKATVVKITSLNENGAEVITDSGKSFFVNSFAPMNGALTLTAHKGDMTIYEFAEIVSGCFDANSTFVNVKWIAFTFNTIKVIVTLEKALGNPDYVVSKWEKAKDAELQLKDLDD